jgi:arylsulfatase
MSCQESPRLSERYSPQWFCKNNRSGRVSCSTIFPFRVSADETLDIGEDTGTPVSEDYHVPFRFTGTLNKVVIVLGKAALSPEEQQELNKQEGANELVD